MIRIIRIVRLSPIVPIIGSTLILRILCSITFAGLLWDETTMTVVRIELENGNNWTTSINTDFDGAVNYFFGAGGFEQPDSSVSPVAAVAEVNEDGSLGQVMTDQEYFEFYLTSAQHGV
jgi:hypothetical protein